MTVHVSVVVPTYHRPRLLERCLEALIRQDFPARDYEVIVADAGNDPSIQRRVESWNEVQSLAGTRPRFCYVPVPGKNHGPAAARNAGWRAAQGEIIAFTDDDCIPTPAWLQAGIGMFGEGVKAACGRIIVPLSDPPTDYENNEAQLSQAEFVTANCFYRRVALESIQGFDERFETAWREDSDLYFSLLERERTFGSDGFLHIPEAVVIHPIRPASWGISLQQQKKSMYNALLYKKHPQLYQQNVSMRPPWHYYRILLALFGGLVSLAAGQKRLSMVFGFIWLGLTAEFTIRRLRHTSHSPSHIMEMALTSILIPPLSTFWRIVGAIRFHVLFL